MELKLSSVRCLDVPTSTPRRQSESVVDQRYLVADTSQRQNIHHPSNTTAGKSLYKSGQRSGYKKSDPANDHTELPIRLPHWPILCASVYFLLVR
ncbi:hypothetical protein ACTXT7_005734 [Hymenolepis weldensis]